MAPLEAAAITRKPRGERSSPQLGVVICHGMGLGRKLLGSLTTNLIRQTPYLFLDLLFRIRYRFTEIGNGVNCVMLAGRLCLGWSCHGKETPS